ncbi:Amidohydrolase family [Acididesulfobacillus acetoxydans]|uniref:5-methylthioadenosine/S-adenosylhomocysteine deaminase n=1 Tax=Acididesulfobacillus acetoxydans TaxID=1561005 RepID=A0A8S0W7R3_9FIRM|nr:amidohydrolase [Acididesulfobacillus acetoxydans]CAA7601049.1 Amidohydrolase family [Acididesulfobacillus acetoxydans]CEJ06923.1 5-methylthioadenosine/S-adenosylhomocysteine deaminase [Acididesulfobacillus acetoxydans]
MKILIKNTTIVTVNPAREVLADAALVVEGNKIADLGPSVSLEKIHANVDVEIDAKGKIVFPGLVNTHTHLFQQLLKGLSDDRQVAQWFSQMTAPCAERLTAENVYVAALAGCMETVRSGVTTLVDFMYAHPQPELSDAVIQAFKELGIRGILARGVMTAGGKYGVSAPLREELPAVKRDVERLFKKFHQSSNRRVRIWLAPSTVWTNTVDSLRAMWYLAQNNDSGMTVHISESQFDREVAREIYGLSDIAVLESLGIAGANLLLVHCVHPDARELRFMKYHDIKVSHNPVSNMYLSSGAAPIGKMLEMGLTVSLATDGPASNNTMDMLEVLKGTALLQKVTTHDPTVITAERVLEMATIEGAKALGMENEVGSLEIGKKADLFLFNPRLSLKAIPMHNPVSTLVYSSSYNNIEIVMIDGNIVLEGGKFSRVNEEEVIGRCQRQAEQLRAEVAARVPHLKERPWRSVAF